MQRLIFFLFDFQWNFENAKKASFDDGVETGENRLAKLIDTLIKNVNLKMFKSL